MFPAVGLGSAIDSVPDVLSRRLINDQHASRLPHDHEHRLVELSAFHRPHALALGTGLIPLPRSPPLTERPDDPPTAPLATGPTPDRIAPPSPLITSAALQAPQAPARTAHGDPRPTATLPGGCLGVCPRPDLLSVPDPRALDRPFCIYRPWFCHGVPVLSIRGALLLPDPSAFPVDLMLAADR